MLYIYKNVASGFTVLVGLKNILLGLNGLILLGLSGISVRDLSKLKHLFPYPCW